LVTPSGETRLAAVIGSPVRHSLSPAIYNAAFEATGLDWVFVTFEVREGLAPAALDAMRTLGIEWLSVTMPLKSATARHVDQLSADALTLEAVNCVVNNGGSLLGDNTDGLGFLRALEHEVGFDPMGRSCVVLGAGGAARAVILALGRAGASEVLVVNRTPDRGAKAATLAGTVGRMAGLDEVATADLVVNATPIGMAGDDGVPVDPVRLRKGQLVVDLVYEPETTPLLAAAAARGLTTVGGIGMLVHQAALQFERVTGRPAPLDVMLEAAREGLRHR
jgi:shikimate dehydrogenase